MRSPTYSSSGVRLVCFDLDGTLVRNSSVSAHLRAALDTRGRGEEIEAAYQRGEISVAALAASTARRFRGLRRRDVWRMLADIPTIGGVDGVVDAFRRDDVHVLLATCTWRFAAEYFQARYGFDAVCGTRMLERDGVMTGVVARCVDGRAKADFLARYCARHDIPLVDCVAIGDSASDSAMFALAGRSIALNGSEEAKLAASSAIDTDDVHELAPVLSRCPISPA